MDIDNRLGNKVPTMEDLAQPCTYSLKLTQLLVPDGGCLLFRIIWLYYSWRFLGKSFFSDDDGRTMDARATTILTMLMLASSYM